MTQLVYDGVSVVACRMTRPCGSRMDQYGPINVCLPLLSALMESLVAAEYKNGQYDVHSLLHGIDRRWTGTFSSLRTPWLVMMSWSRLIVVSLEGSARGHGRCRLASLVGILLLLGSEARRRRMPIVNCCHANYHMTKKSSTLNLWSLFIIQTANSLFFSADVILSCTLSYILDYVVLYNYNSNTKRKKLHF